MYDRAQTLGHHITRVRAEPGGPERPGQRVRAGRGDRHAVQRYVSPPVIRQQTGGTCGCYTLWMAYEGLHGQDDEIIDLILTSARRTTLLGENFSYPALQNLVADLNPRLTQANKQTLTLGQKSFVNLQQFYDAIAGSSSSEALMIAYSADSLYGLESKTDPSQAAHWSLVESIAKRQVTIVNPWAQRDVFDIKALLKSNLDLQTHFNWTYFAREILDKDSTLYAQLFGNWEIEDFANGIGRSEERVRSILTRLADQRPNFAEAIELSGFLVTVS